MSIVSAICSSFKSEILSGIHNLATDTLKCALFASTASLDATTTVYAATGEATGAGYTAGGIIVTPATGFPTVDGAGRGVCRFNNVIWPAATVTARGLLIYNASKANRAIIVLDFAVDKSSVALPFSVEFPLALDPLIVVT